MDNQILIVGAGPTGLTAAIELRRFGLPVRLIDKADHSARWSQALAVQARTLEQLERYGLAEEAVSQGLIVRAAHFHDGRESLARFEIGEHIPGRYPFLLCLPQNETEDILTRHLRTLGVEIERNVELTGFSNTAAGSAVTAHLHHSDGPRKGQAESTDFRFLLGCDGAHSRVRSGTLTPFTGDTVAERFVLGDLDLTGSDVPGTELSLYFSTGGWAMFLLKLPSGQHRVITIFPRESGSGVPAENKTPTLADFNADFKRFGLDITTGGASWLAPFHVNERKAEEYRHGNTFLLGDAAHIHSPVGGQGMNTGIQDAANLAWKLAAVIGGAPETLLDSYNDERGAVARDVLRGSSFGLRFAGSANPIMERLRNFALQHAAHSDFLTQKAADGVSETGINHRKSSIVMDDVSRGPLHAGDRMPNPDLPGGGTLLASLHQAQHLLIALDVPAAEVPRDLKNTARLELYGASSLESTLGKGPLLYLVRPDGYIGFRGAADGEKLRGYARTTGLIA